MSRTRYGSNNADVLYADNYSNSYNDTLIGGGGDDAYYLNSYGEQYDYGSYSYGNWKIVENAGGGTDTVYYYADDYSSYRYFELAENVENFVAVLEDYDYVSLSVHGNSQNNSITTGADNDYLYGHGGKDTLIGGDENDTYYVDSADDVIVEKQNLDPYGYDRGGMYDYVYSSALNYTLSANVEGIDLDYSDANGNQNLNATGNASNNYMDGNDGNNILIGAAGNDRIYGNDGNDNIDGGDDHDYLIGGYGNDTLNGGNGNDSIDGGEGNDLINAGAGDDYINNYDAYAKDTLNGGLGNDTYYIYGKHTITETGAGTDTVYFNGFNYDYSLGEDQADIVLGANIEIAYLYGYAYRNLTGNASDNYLVGNGNSNVISGLGGADVLIGGGGNDTLIGGDGNDTYIVDNQYYQVVEANTAAGGIDTVVAYGDYQLGTGLENLLLAGDDDYYSESDAYNGTGNELNNAITGNDWDNALYGLNGNDTLNGGYGEDTLFGGAGNDVLNSGDFDYGFNLMLGGAGNDTYIVNSQYDFIGEIDEGTAGKADKVILATSFYSSTYTYTLVSNVENLDASALYDSLNLIGNASANSIIGTNYNDILNGGSGNDTLAGGKGDDTYYADSTTDTVTELANQGTDTVIASKNFTLAANVENLTLINLAATGTGNGSDNTILGNSAQNTLSGAAGNDYLNGYYGDDSLDGGIGNDTLVGGAGADTLNGGANDDTYYFGAGDKVIDSAGVDTVYTTLTTVNDTVLGAVNAIENLIYQGSSSVNYTGNTLNNILQGGSSNDTLTGGAGNDTYYYTFGDVINESTVVGSGTADKIFARYHTVSLADTVVGGGNAIENLSADFANYNSSFNLTGNALANIIEGGDYDDSLDGGAGVDTLVGGKGSDTYVVDSATDKITEKFGYAEGSFDRVFVNANVNYVLSDNLEYLDLRGTNLESLAFNNNGTGNAINNTIYGSTGNNVLLGLGGDDYIFGGAGNDTVDGGVGNDVIYGDAGSDSLSGGDGNDAIEGGSENDTLLGGAGNDTLNGGTGNDSMSGGLGNDYYYVDSLTDVVVEGADVGVDTIGLTATLAASSTYTLANNVENLEINTSATNVTFAGNAGNNTFYNYYGGSNKFQGGAGNDTFVYYSQAAAVVTVEGGTVATEVNTLSLNLYNAADQFVVSGIKQLEINNQNNSTADFETPLDADVAFDSVTIKNSSGNLTLTGINPTSNFVFDSSYFNLNLTDTGSFAGGSDNLDLLTINSNAGLTVSGLETVSVVAQGESNALSLNAAGTTVNLTGEGAFSLLNLQSTNSLNVDDFIGELHLQKAEGNSSQFTVDLDNVALANIAQDGNDALNLVVSGNNSIVLDDSGQTYNISGENGGEIVLTQFGYSSVINASNYTGKLIVNSLSAALTITGGDGDDIISGADYSIDTIAGGDGDDQLSGGEGTDYFVFDGGIFDDNAETAENAGIDQIADFNEYSDSIVLNTTAGASGLVFNDGVLDASSFSSAWSVEDAEANASENATILFEASSGALFYDADGSGEGLAVQFAQLMWLDGEPNYLTHEDIFSTIPVLP